MAVPGLENCGWVAERWNKSKLPSVIGARKLGPKKGGTGASVIAGLVVGRPGGGTRGRYRNPGRLQGKGLGGLTREKIFGDRGRSLGEVWVRVVHVVLDLGCWSGVVVGMWVGMEMRSPR